MVCVVLLLYGEEVSGATFPRVTPREHVFGHAEKLSPPAWLLRKRRGDSNACLRRNRKGENVLCPFAQGGVGHAENPLPRRGFYVCDRYDALGLLDFYLLRPQSYHRIDPPRTPRWNQRSNQRGAEER